MALQTSTCFAMFVMKKMIGALLLKLEIDYLGLRSSGERRSMTMRQFIEDEDDEDDDVGVGHAEIGGIGRHPNMYNANIHRAIHKRLGEIVNDVDELTYVGVNFMADTLGYSAAPSPFASQFGEWLKFNNRNFSLDSRKEFRKRFSEIRIKEIEFPRGLDFEEFSALHEGMALQNLNQFCHIKEQVVWEYVMEFLASFTFRDHIEELDTADIMIPKVARDDDVGVRQAEIGGVGRHPIMSNANRLRAMDERLGEIINNVDELTYVVSGMSEQYD
ncbi:hypothetical protein Tco_0613983 [Tanacetum coccineum]